MSVKMESEEVKKITFASIVVANSLTAMRRREDSGFGQRLTTARKAFSAGSIVSKTYMTRVEGENTRLRHYLARLHRKTLCYSKPVEMLAHSIRLQLHYPQFHDVPIC
jgi:transcriptional regulator NrdR family protein